MDDVNFKFCTNGAQLSCNDNTQMNTGVQSTVASDIIFPIRNSYIYLFSLISGMAC